MTQKNKQVSIINSPTEFFVFSTKKTQDKINVILKDDTLWLSVKMIAEIFDCTTDNIYIHLKNIFNNKELEENQVTEDFSVTANDGKTYKTKYYNLDMIISIGYRVNSVKATHFRKWATAVLKEYTIKGFVLDDNRLKNGIFFDEDYFDELLARIKDIRASERRFYQKITDIYATAYDYDKNNPITKTFFATVQNKLHFAIHGQTAAEVIVDRADATKNHMGLTSWKASPDGKIVETDTIIAKNYLTHTELDDLNSIVVMYLDYAQMQAKKRIPMTMKDWENKLNSFLQFNERSLLTNAGKVSQAFAENHALTEFEKYRPIQDKNFLSDFDKELQQLEINLL